MSADVADTPLPLNVPTPAKNDRQDNVADNLDDIPAELRFDFTDRDDNPDTADRTPFALGPHRLYARRPKDFTMLALASAMSGMADNGDIAYAVMLFCTDAFDGPTRQMISKLDDTDLYALIQILCDRWGEDTSKWNKEGGNRQQRRAAKSGGGRTRRK